MRISSPQLTNQRETFQLAVHLFKAVTLLNQIGAATEVTAPIRLKVRKPKFPWAQREPVCPFVPNAAWALRVALGVQAGRCKKR
jgi:hypothetical protein